MNRRNLMKAIGAAPVAVLATGAGAFSQSSNICVFMEERDGAFVLEGSGQLLTEVFELESGRYRIEVELSNFGRFDTSIWVHFYNREDGRDEPRFYYNFNRKEPEVVSGSVEMKRGGEYVAEVEFSGDWKIVLSPI